VVDNWGVNPGETTGTVAFAYANGIVGNGAKLDGTSGAIYSLDPSSNLLGSSTFTISLWFKTTNSVSSQMFLFDKNKTGAGRFSFDISGGLPVYGLNQAGITNYVIHHLSNCVPQTTSGAYNHIVICRTGDRTFADYFNGTETLITVFANVGAGTIGALPHNGPLFIGRRNLAAVNFFDGSMDEIRIYNRTLSSDEVKRLYIMGKLIFQNR
jgi:hypothetical protein